MSDEIAALETLKLSSTALRAVECIVAEACSTTLFHFFCLMDDVADPEVMKVGQWSGAEFASPSDERAEFHDEFCEKYWVYDKLTSV